MISFAKLRQLCVRHLHFVGPGLVSSVAYIDPGNWATDLQAGAEYGYKLLFIVFIAGLAAVVLQLLAVRLGAVTSKSLAEQTRLLFLRLEAKHPKWRIPLRGTLWFLYIIAEIAIIATDLAELIGSAIALNLLFPSLPLFGGVLVTAADVLVVLIFFRSERGRQGMLAFEIIIVSLVIAVFISFMLLLKWTKPDWREVFIGLVPSATLVQPGALYVGIGIIGATVMPHALYLGSSLASVDRLNMLPVPPGQEVQKSFTMPKLLKSMSLNRMRSKREKSPLATENAIPLSTLSRVPLDRLDSDGNALDKGKDIPLSQVASRDGVDEELESARNQYEAELRSFDRIKWVQVHVLHATIDTSMSLLGFALTINAAILTVAGAAFFYTGQNPNNATLQGAFELIMSYIGNAAAIIFALALLCAGQSASITATLAGQIVSEGFINWRTSPFLRRLVTRIISVIPAAVVAASIGNAGLNTMLVASQVLLSIVLPFVIFPLVLLTSKEDIMTVLGPEPEVAVGPESPQAPVDTSILPVPESEEVAHLTVAGSSRLPPPSPSPAPASDSEEGVRDTGSIAAQSQGAEAVAPQRRSMSFKSPLIVTILGYFLFVVVIVCNVYVIVQLGMGND